MNAPARSAAVASVPNENRVPALDGLRGLAILLGMQHHFCGLG